MIFTKFRIIQNLQKGIYKALFIKNFKGSAV